MLKGVSDSTLRQTERKIIVFSMLTIHLGIDISQNKAHKSLPRYYFP